LLLSASEPANGNDEALVLFGLWDLLRHYPLHREPVFARLKLADKDVASLLHGEGVLAFQWRSRRSCKGQQKGLLLTIGPKAKRHRSKVQLFYLSCSDSFAAGSLMRTVWSPLRY
jgi:hypothetical protein